MDDDIKKELVSLGHSRWSERDQEAVLTAVSEIERLENEVKRLRAENAKQKAEIIRLESQLRSARRGVRRD